MSQRDSGYARKERDLYETPAWVTDALIPHIPYPLMVWEPACASGKMVDALLRHGLSVLGTDIAAHPDEDFMGLLPREGTDAIITNPPYVQAEQFIVRALDLMRPVGGYVAMLLRTDYDHAAGRRYLFAEPFAKKVVLTKRIKWFEDSKGSPSFNHGWFIWNWEHKGPPTIAYGP